MKSWEPEQVFEKPDFPSIKRKEKQAGKQGKEAGSKSGSPSRRDPAPAPRGEVISKENLGGRIQAWVPGNVQPAGARPASAPPGQKPGAKIPDKGPAWVPDQEFTRADFPRRTEPAGAKPVNGQRSAGTGEAAPARTDSALPEKFLRDLILTFPDNTVNQLRNWYWAKQGTPRNDPALAAVLPHERIFIILASAGKQVTEYIFTMMSPKERGLMQSILKQPYKPLPAQIQTVRNAFSNAIRGEN